MHSFSFHIWAWLSWQGRLCWMWFSSSSWDQQALLAGCSHGMAEAQEVKLKHERHLWPRLETGTLSFLLIHWSKPSDQVNGWGSTLYSWMWGWGRKLVFLSNNLIYNSYMNIYLEARISVYS